MRVLVVHPGPHFSVSDVCTGVVKGFVENGCDVRVLDYNQRLSVYHAAHVKKKGRWVPAFSHEDAIRVAAQWIKTACYDFWPHLVVVVSGMFIPPDIWGILRYRDHHVVAWMTESPYEDERQLNVAQYVDTVVVNDPLNIRHFLDINPRTYYLPHSYDPDIHKPGPGLDKWRADFGFVGTGFPSRIEFFESIDWSGISAKVAGNWMMLGDESPLLPFLTDERGQCFDNTDTVTLYNSVKVSANMYRREHHDKPLDTADGWAVGPREIELAATGTFFLRETRPESDALFPMMPTFESSEEFGDLIRYWAPRNDEREAAVKAAMAAVEDRTFTNTTRRLLKLIDPDHVRRRLTALTQGASHGP